jgi:hypothetical protein
MIDETRMVVYAVYIYAQSTKYRIQYVCIGQQANCKVNEDKEESKGSGEKKIEKKTEEIYCIVGKRKKDREGRGEKEREGLPWGF